MATLSTPKPTTKNTQQTPQKTNTTHTPTLAHFDNKNSLGMPDADKIRRRQGKQTHKPHTTKKNNNPNNKKPPIKQHQVWLLLGWVTAERSCPCKQPACPAIGGGDSEVIFKSLVPKLC
ncbi:hypothetical protein J6590_050858 [Homalodisca vitripennis]|nr:hypothetical protein J6590_050858 [Homalodisca vitripennis]